MQNSPYLPGSFHNLGGSGGGSPKSQWNSPPILSHDVRPGATYGATITPGNNVYGAYTQVIAGASVTMNIYQVDITISGISVSASAKDALVTIGVDPAGGSSYTDTIQHLLAGYAGGYGNTLTGGITYRFPLFISAGSSIAAKCSVNNVTVGTAKVAVTLYGNPSNLAGLAFGTTVTTFGATVGTSNGTAITAGTTSEGALTQVGGTVSAPVPWFWLVAAANANDAAQNNGQHFVDLAIGPSSGSNTLVIANQIVLEDSTEANGAVYVGAQWQPNVGDAAFVRIQSATATTAYSAIVYAVT